MALAKQRRDSFHSGFHPYSIELRCAHSLSPRKWTVNGAINVDEVRGRYYVDPGTQDITTQCLSAVSDGTYMLLAGARASGKTTRLFWLHQKLVEMGYYVF